ncbi:MAG TPA: alanine racemase [Ilumatobacteraceae bacterium]|nr:alanine racemase [Ilumatobacteraceae bacterium]HRB01973.1 alanine racemase [Ilumatobacteraceae bacterium]
MSRWAWAEVSVSAIEHNVRTIAEIVSPAQVWVAVKAEGYGHGALLAARAAQAAGAQGLCVALVQEGVALREAGISGPILVLSEQPVDALRAAVQHQLATTVYSVGQLAELEACGAIEHPVHLKIDTGMRRVGVAEADAVALAQMIAASPAVSLAGVFTHLAVADEPDNPFTEHQLDRFDAVLAALSAVGIHPPLVHAANSAGALAHPRARYDMVRPGIGVYGISSGPGVDQLFASLQPAMSLHARVSHVKRVAAGERISYGLRHTFETATTVATLPIGYADGVPRRLHAVGGTVLIGGTHRPIVGAVTMDQIMVDCGFSGDGSTRDDHVQVGDEAVLIGTQGTHTITAADWAAALDTIAYEIVCGISSRIERRAC